MRLADFGLAKGAEEPPVSGAAAVTHLSTMGGVKGTPEYMDPLILNSGGRFSELTDGFAMGVTMLVLLTRLGAADILQRCRAMLRNPDRVDKWAAPGVPDATAGEWPDVVQCGLATLVCGLSLENFKVYRMPLVAALETLEQLCRGQGIGEGAADQACAAEMDARQPLPECIICMDAPRQVRFRCGHALCCNDCLPACLATKYCPTCREELRREEAGDVRDGEAAATFVLSTPREPRLATNTAQPAMPPPPAQPQAQATGRRGSGGRGGRGGRGRGRAAADAHA